MKINICKKCVLPDTRPNIDFNKYGICSVCSSATNKDKINWKKQRIKFINLVKKIKSKSLGYDILIPVSGGKDSTYQAYFMKEVYGMNPLCVCFETTYATNIGNQNLDNISKLGIDVIHFKKNHPVYKN